MQLLLSLVLMSMSPALDDHLGAALGTPEYTKHFVSEKADQWCSELGLLSEIAVTQPHAAYAAFTH